MRIQHAKLKADASVKLEEEEDEEGVDGDAIKAVHANGEDVRNGEGEQVTAKVHETESNEAAKKRERSADTASPVEAGTKKAKTPDKSKSPVKSPPKSRKAAYYNGDTSEESEFENSTSEE